MKYRPTPLNIASGLVIGFSIYAAINPGPEGWGILALFYVFPFGVIGLFFDFFLQKTATKYRQTFLIESLVIGGLFIWYASTQRTKTLIIPDHLPTKYIVTIYGVDKAPKLPKGLFTWSYEVKVPENGILLTSSDFGSDLPETKIKTYSGIELNTGSSELGWVDYSDETLICNGKTYFYNRWMVDKNCCMSTNQEVDSFKILLQRQFCNSISR